MIAKRYLQAAWVAQRCILAVVLFCTQAGCAREIHGSPTEQHLGARAESKDFLVFDGTQFKNKPDLSRYGIRPINILYVSKIWPKWSGGVGPNELPDEAHVRRLARAAKQKGQVLVLDIEHWRLHGDDGFVASNVAKYITVLQWFKQEEPSLRVGYFGMLPIEDYDRSRSNIAFKYRAWQKENDRLAPLARFVDVIFPSIYTYNSNEQEWVKFARENIKEARRYGKPVYVFLWPQYSEQNKVLAHQYLSSSFWKLQLETVRQYADGVVIWGGWDSSKWGPADWDGQAGWWQATEKFMTSVYIGKEKK